MFLCLYTVTLLRTQSFHLAGWEEINVKVTDESVKRKIGLSFISKTFCTLNTRRVNINAAFNSSRGINFFNDATLIFAQMIFIQTP